MSNHERFPGTYGNTGVCCREVPSREAYWEAVARLAEAHPDWSQTRCEQRARVEVILAQVPHPV